MAKKKPTGDHVLAVEVAMVEGGAESLSIAQIKEVIKILRKMGRLTEVIKKEGNE